MPWTNDVKSDLTGHAAECFQLAYRIFCISGSGTNPEEDFAEIEALSESLMCDIRQMVELVKRAPATNDLDLEAGPEHGKVKGQVVDITIPSKPAFLPMFSQVRQDPTDE